ncbi:unnamed protein product [Musa textilis]
MAPRGDAEIRSSPAGPANASLEEQGERPHHDPQPALCSQCTRHQYGVFSSCCCGVRPFARPKMKSGVAVSIGNWFKKIYEHWVSHDEGLMGFLCARNLNVVFIF